MRVDWKLRWAAVLLGLSVLTAPVMAQEVDKNDPNRVVLRVNGVDITAAELRFTANEVLPFLSKVDGKQRTAIIARTLIERHLLAQAAEKEAEIANAATTKQLQEFYNTKALYDAYILERIAKNIDEDQVRSRYEQEATKADLPERVRARHILLATQEEANEVLKKMQAGTSFEDLAKQFSLDGSKQFGGDLGYFSANEMVPAFSQAAYGLKVGETSKPVQTEFGWHIIRLEDRKKGTPPPYEQVRQQLLQQTRSNRVQRELVRLSKDAKIEILDPELRRLEELAASNQARALQQQQQQQQQGDQAPAASGSGKGDRQ